MKKRGLSEVITTLVMILLVIVAIGIVWLVIRNVIQESSEGITVEQLKINAEIRTATIDNSSGNASVTIKRNSGESKPIGFVLIFSNGTQTEQFKIYEVVNELETKTFYVQMQNLTANEIRTVSIASIHSSDSGKESFSNILDEYKIKKGTVAVPATNQTQNSSQNSTQNLTIYYLDSDSDGFGNLTQITQNSSQPQGYVSNSNDCNDANANINPSITEQALNNGIDEDCSGTDWTITGLIGYWRFENNADDSSGNGNHGTSFGTTNQSGKTGDARSFDGVNDYVDLSSHITSLEGRNQGTVAGWFKVEPATQNAANYIFTITDKDTGTEFMQVGVSGIGSFSTSESLWFLIRRGNVNLMYMYLTEGETSYHDGQWHHFAVSTGDGNNKIIVDGQTKTPTFSFGGLSTNEFSNINNPDTIRMGSRNYQAVESFSNITLDEIMIFNRSLTTQEIQDIYNRQN